MGKFIGRRVEVGVGREVTRGVAVAPGIWIPRADFNFNDRVIKARDVSGIGKIADSLVALNVTRYSEGDLVMNLRSQAIGYFLYSLLGTLATTGPADTTAYTHAFTIAETNQHQSLTFYIKNPDNTNAFKLAMVNSLEFVATLDELVQVNASILSKKGNAWTVLTPSYTTESLFHRSHVKVKVAANIAGLAAASVLSIKALRININQNVIRDGVLGSAEPEDNLNQQLSVEGEIVLNLEDETWKNYLKTPTDRAMEIFFENTDDLVAGSAVTRPSLKIQLPKVDFDTWEPDNTLDEIVTQTLSFKGSYDLANSQNIIHLCQLVNAKVSY